MKNRDSMALEKKHILLAGYLTQQLDQGVSHDQLIDQLVEQGLSCDEAEAFMDKVLGLYESDPSTQKVLRAALQQEKARTRMKTGFGIFLLGGIVTGASYLFAKPSGTFVICYGAMILGAIYFVLGCFEWLANRLGTQSYTKTLPFSSGQFYHIEERNVSNLTTISQFLRRSKKSALDGRYQDAADILEKALKCNQEWGPQIAGYPRQTSLHQSEMVSGYALLIHLAGKAGKKELALQYFKRMLELNPKNPGDARQAAREAKISKEAKEIAKNMGISWSWWEY
jgi:tetratricopeptide (TPR) repeat protein